MALSCPSKYSCFPQKDLDFLGKHLEGQAWGAFFKVKYRFSREEYLAEAQTLD